MSTWTLGPDVVLTTLFAVALVLSATLTQAAVQRGDPPGAILPAGATALPVIDKTVVIAAPQGYCIDSLSSIDGERAAFVLMASCRSMTENPGLGLPEVRGLLTASVDGAPGAFPSHRDLAQFFASRSGRAALSRSGDADAMDVGAVFSRGEVLYLHASETGGDPAMGGHSWRAVFEVNGRMVTATLRDFAADPISEADGFRTVEGLVESIFAASPDTR